jgi:hypothetical protein
MCYIQISIIVISIIMLSSVLLYCINKKKIQENWESYSQTPLNYIQSGSSPLAYYRRDRYRKPYRYPIKHYDSSPYPNMSYWH